MPCWYCCCAWGNMPWSCCCCCCCCCMDVTCCSCWCWAWAPAAACQPFCPTDQLLLRCKLAPLELLLVPLLLRLLLPPDLKVIPPLTLLFLPSPAPPAAHHCMRGCWPTWCMAVFALLLLNGVLKLVHVPGLGLPCLLLPVLALMLLLSVAAAAAACGACLAGPSCTLLLLPGSRAPVTPTEPWPCCCCWCGRWCC